MSASASGSPTFAGTSPPFSEGKCQQCSFSLLYEYTSPVGIALVEIAPHKSKCEVTWALPELFILLLYHSVGIAIDETVPPTGNDIAPSAIQPDTPTTENTGPVSAQIQPDTLTAGPVSTLQINKLQVNNHNIIM